MAEIKKIKKSTTKSYFIATSLDESIVHYGTIEKNNETVSGQPVLTSFKKENEYLDELNRLGITI